MSMLFDMVSSNLCSKLQSVHIITTKLRTMSCFIDYWYHLYIQSLPGESCCHRARLAIFVEMINFTFKLLFYIYENSGKGNLQTAFCE